MKRKVVIRRLLVLVVAAAVVGGERVSSQGGGLAGLAGLGELTGSFFAHDAYVGARQFDLFRVRPAVRLDLDGLTVMPIEGLEWFRAAPRSGTPDMIQEVWFVKQPHRFTDWAHRDRIPARPVTAFARMQVSGEAAGLPRAEIVAGMKRRELERAGAEVVTLEASAITIGATACVRYSATLIDRGVPPGFAAQPFEVTAAGTVCPHPDAPWLAIEAGHTQRRAPGEPALPAAPELERFLEGVRTAPLRRPVVVRQQAVGREGDPAAIGRGWMRAVLAGNAIWLSEDSRGDRHRVVQLDLALEPIAQRDAHGTVFAATDDSVWLVDEAGTISRMDARSGETTLDRPADCRPSASPAILTQSSATYGIWIPCVLDDPTGARKVSGAFARLDPQTGSVVATVPVKEHAADIRAGARGLWGLEEPVRLGNPCRLHHIDPLTNQIVRTVALKKSPWCRLLAVAEDGLWIGRGVGDRAELADIDATSGAVRRTIRLPEFLSITGLAAIDANQWWLAVRTDSLDARGLAAFGTQGGLLQFDRRTNQLTGRLVPTGAAHWLIGASRDSIWLNDGMGTVTRVSLR